MPKLKCTGPISEVVVRARKTRGLKIKHEPGTIIEVDAWLVDPLVESGKFELIVQPKPKKKVELVKEEIEKGKE